MKNINNTAEYEDILDIYNFFEENKAKKLYPIFQKRISQRTLKKAMAKVEKQHPDMELVLFSDIENNLCNYKQIGKDEIKHLNSENNIAVLAFNRDFLATEIIDELAKYNIKYFAGIQPYPLTRYFYTDKNAWDTMAEEGDENSGQSWHLSPGDFENIFQALNVCKDLEGDFVEIGTFRGDSAAAALNYMKKTKINKTAYFLDTFEGFNYDDAYKSKDMFWKNTHTQTSYDKVKERLSKYDNAVVLKSNIITDELPEQIEKIAIANIDVDMYEAVKAGLYKVKDKIVKNGIIIAEDYGHTPTLIGAQKATKEFIAENPNMFIPLYFSSGQMFLIRK